MGVFEEKITWTEICSTRDDSFPAEGAIVFFWRKDFSELPKIRRMFKNAENGKLQWYLSKRKKKYIVPFYVNDGDMWAYLPFPPNYRTDS